MQVEILLMPEDILAYVRTKFPDLPDDGWFIKDEYGITTYVWDSKRHEPLAKDEVFLDEICSGEQDNS